MLFALVLIYSYEYKCKSLGLCHANAYSRDVDDHSDVGRNYRINWQEPADTSALK